VKSKLMRLILLLLSTAFLVTTAFCAESAGGLTWTVPARWHATLGPGFYELDVDIRDRTVCIVSVFPLKPGDVGEDGSKLVRTEDALAGWRNEFLPDAEYKIERRIVNGVTFDTLDVSGTIRAPLEGFAQPDYRRLVAIAQGSRGRLVIFLNGPRSVVSAHLAEFEDLVGSIRRD
jgi:hypothetical protein